jgi:hypothetical protein
MMRLGQIRISPASFYERGSLLKSMKSMKDLELERVFRIPAYKEALSGRTEVDYRGKSLPIENGALSLSVVGNDYYLFSTCLEVDRRMPTDFEATGALVIKDKGRFVEQFRRAFERQFGECFLRAGQVYYYDPYRLPPKHFLHTPEFLKHFGYSYQKEHRIVVRPKERSIGPEPIFFEIGALSDFCELVEF